MTSSQETINYIKENMGNNSIYSPIIKSLQFPITEEEAEQAIKECKKVQSDFYEAVCNKYGF